MNQTRRLGLLSALVNPVLLRKGRPHNPTRVANRVQDHLRRHEVVNKLKANEKCPFSEDDMKAMSVDHLEKLEQSIRPVDYSGAGGFASNSAAIDENVTPLVPRGALQRKKEA